MSSADPQEQMNDNLLQQLRHDPRKYVQSLWRHPQRPEDRYDFKGPNGETKLNYLLHDDGPLNPDSWGAINILKIHRGGLKTTTVTAIASWAHHMYLSNGLQTYMTAPREKPPIDGFMREFKEKADHTGLDTHRRKNNQYEQIFEIQRQDEYGNSFSVNSVLEADSGYNPDTLRGPHSHVGIIDEFQDIGKPAFDTYSHCIDQELPNVDYFPCIWIIGTPKETGSFYETLWDYSDQKSWDRETNQWVPETDPGNYKPDQDALDEMPMDVDTDDVPEREVRGWHVDCYNSPMKNAAEIAQAKQNNSRRKFKNEMEAVFFDPADNLLTADILTEQFFDTEQGFSSRRQFDETTVTVVADWGGGSDENAADTVVSVGEWLRDDDGGVECVLHEADFLDDQLTPQEEIQTVEEYVIQYDVDRGVVDFGHGDKKYTDLQDGNGTLDDNGYVDTIKACRFSNIKDKQSVKWDDNSGQRRYFTVDKSYRYEEAVDAVKNGVFTCPSANLSFDGQTSKGTKIERQLTAPNKSLSTTSDGRKKKKIETDDKKNDDFADCLVFHYLAYNEVDSVSIPAAVSMSSRPGYH